MSDKKEKKWSFTDSIFDSLVKSFESGDAEALKSAIAKGEELLEKFNNGETVTVKNGEDIAGRTPEEVEVFTKASNKKQDDIMHLWSQWYKDSGKGDPEDLNYAQRMALANEWYKTEYPKLLDSGVYKLSSGELAPAAQKKRDEGLKTQKEAMTEYEQAGGDTDIPLALQMLKANSEHAKKHPEKYQK